MALKRNSRERFSVWLEIFHPIISSSNLKRVPTKRHTPVGANLKDFPLERGAEIGCVFFQQLWGPPKLWFGFGFPLKATNRGVLQTEVSHN